MPRWQTDILHFALDGVLPFGDIQAALDKRGREGWEPIAMGAEHEFFYVLLKRRLKSPLAPEVK